MMDDNPYQPPKTTDERPRPRPHLMWLLFAVGIILGGAAILFVLQFVLWHTF